MSIGTEEESAAQMQKVQNELSSDELPPTQIRNTRSAAELSASSGATIAIDDSHVMAAYANFCRVSSTPEELILDLGLNPQPMNPDVSKVSVSQRVIMNHYTAKRLFAAVSTALHRHETAFGVLETDVRQRLRGT